VPYVCLAIGDERRVSGMDFITAFVAGYEVMARVGKGGSLLRSTEDLGALCCLELLELSLRQGNS
jgi:2-methylcitrate dehydratase PrpD